MLSLKVTDIKEDYPGFKTYTIKHGLNAKPGQFVMVWLPGVDEVPMSIGWQTETEFKMGIANAGDCTKAIHDRFHIKFDNMEIKNISFQDFCQPF